MHDVNFPSCDGSEPFVVTGSRGVGDHGSDRVIAASENDAGCDRLFFDALTFVG